MSSPWPGTASTTAGNACSRKRAGTGDPLYGVRRVLRTGDALLTDRQHERLTSVFADENHVQVEATWASSQRIVTAYRHPDRTAGKTALPTVVDALSHVPPVLTELITLGGTLMRRAGDVLAYFDRPVTPNGPTEAINAVPRAPPAHRPRLRPTSPTTSPDHCSTPAASGTGYTLILR